MGTGQSFQTGRGRASCAACAPYPTTMEARSVAVCVATWFLITTDAGRSVYGSRDCPCVASRCQCRCVQSCRWRVRRIAREAHVRVPQRTG